MKVWVATKTEERRDILLNEKVIPLGRNVSTADFFAHVSLTPFKPGYFALDVIGADTNQAWIFELEIPDRTLLEADPSKDRVTYGGDWRVSKEPIVIDQILSMIAIPDVQAWESEDNSR